MSERFQGLVETLEQLAYFHRASAHVLHGWAPKIADLSVKAMAARHAFEDLDQAQKLKSHIYAVTRGSGWVRRIPERWASLMKRIDGAASWDQVVFAIYGVVKRHLFALYESTLVAFHPVLDATLMYIVPPAMELMKRQLAIGAKIMNATMAGDGALFGAKIDADWSTRHEGELIDSEHGLWSPLDRVPLCVRPEGMRRGLSGALRLIPDDAFTDPQGIGLLLHNLINGEYTTLELMSRSLYEHPDLPATFQLHLARQASDEARHAQAIEGAALHYGVRYGDYPIYTLTYDGYYQFDPCPPGSKKELLWRLLIRGTIDEGLALDDFAFQVKTREHLGQPLLADLFRYLLADEIFHAQAALKWTKWLSHDDANAARDERAEANRWLNDMLDERRRRYVEAHPEDAIREVEKARRLDASGAADPLPFERAMNAPARKEAGFEEADLAQIIGWGYVKAPTSP
jgi:uncharacterized ferritin-like protein (DUF455 family)